MLAISPRPNAISPAKVKEWRGRRKSDLNDDQCAAIADALNRQIRWPEDPKPQPEDPNFITVIEDDEAEADHPWDFKEAGTSAKNLLTALPRLLAHWEDACQHLPGSTICQDLREVERTLSAAREYIEFPLGRPIASPRIPRASKTWQTYSHLIARIVIDQMIQNGRTKVAVSRNSVVVRIVHCALLHMEVEHIHTVERSGISAFLTRWDEVCGLTPQGIAKLTTNDPNPFAGHSA